MKKIPKKNYSLHYNAWLDHTDSIFLAACENYRQFNETLEEPSSLVANEQLALFYSTCLLFSISIELIFKARILFELKPDIDSGKISRFEDLANEWPGGGHDILKLVKKYNIEITSEEKDIIQRMQPFMVWAGRFPFPKKEDEIKKFERGEIGLDLPERIDIKIGSIINKQRNIMGSTTTPVRVRRDTEYF